jgi:hypothetical protein
VRHCYNTVATTVKSGVSQPTGQRHCLTCLPSAPGRCQSPATHFRQLDPTPSLLLHVVQHRTPPPLLPMLEVLGEPCHCLSCPAHSPGTPPTLPAHLFLHHRPTSRREACHYTGRGCGDCAQCARWCATSRGRPSLLAMGQAGQAVAGPASCGFGPKSGPRLFR